MRISWRNPRLAVACDGKCHKAWGYANRPRVQLDPNDEDDYELLADHEVGEAPADPGTYDGSAMEGKPEAGAKKKMNLWCLRSCERSVRIEGELKLPIKLPDFSKRIPNKRPEGNPLL